MDVEAFERWLQERDRSDIEWLIDALAASTDTADAEVERLRATREVERRLARTGRRRQASEARHSVHVCAMAVCDATGVSSHDRAGSVQVARAAGEAATALVAGADEPCCELLIRPFLGASLHRPDGRAS